MHPGDEWVLQPVRNGEGWKMVESYAALSATAIDRKPACRHPKAELGGEGRRILRWVTRWR